MTKYVAYYRVSTAEQGNSKLGLEAQEATIKQFTKNCNDCVIAHFKDVASGKDNTREILLQAIEHAKTHDAVLLISKLDRLSRNAAFIFQLRDKDVKFVCCDMPEGTTVNIGIFATLAQHERELISSRTKAALQAKKDRGDKLGNPNGFMGQDKATETKKAKAVQNASSDNTIEVKDRIKEIIELAGFKKESLSLSIVASRLSKYTTSTGKPFTTHNVVPLLKVVLKELNLTSLPKFESQA